MHVQNVSKIEILPFQFIGVWIENHLPASDQAEALLPATRRRGWPRSQGRYNCSSDLVSVFIADCNVEDWRPEDCDGRVVFGCF